MDDASKTKKGIETRQKILEEASMLFAQNGFHSVTVRQIAQNVGIRESSLYNHFSSKELILQSLYDYFTENAHMVRPSEAELDELFLVMEPEELFKYIVFFFGRNIDPLLENTAMIITNEKYKDARAAEIYYEHVVNGASAYYERIIEKLIDSGKFKKVNARLFAEQYNYACIALTKEYYMAKNGLADLHTVVKYMITTLEFYCQLMKP